VRGTDGSVVPYPVVEFTARENICSTTLCPAQVSAELRAAATKVASDAISCLPGVGIFGVELFAMADGTVYLNEVAPRPHNSGHFTIEACGCSQFEAHLRAVAGLPLPKDTSLRVGASLMVNILGDPGGSMGATKAELSRLSDVPGAAPHWYGKEESRKGRKMAHVTFCASSTAALRANLEPVADILGAAAMPAASPVVGVIMGSDSDLPCMKAAVEILQQFGVPHEVAIVSAHRTPERMFLYAKGAVSRGLRCIIAGAGGAAHLPGMVAALTPLPVIGCVLRSLGLGSVLVLLLAGLTCSFFFHLVALRFFDLRASKFKVQLDPAAPTHLSVNCPS
jgi:phosphoribosylaminoimidazole carboxylase